MNNSQVVEMVDDIEEPNQRLNADEARLVRIIEALQTIQSSSAWSTLKIEVFDSLVNVLEKDIKTEAERPDLSSLKLNRIAGKLEWARRYSDLHKFESEKRVELQNIRLQLYGRKAD